MGFPFTDFSLLCSSVLDLGTRQTDGRTDRQNSHHCITPPLCAGGPQALSILVVTYGIVRAKFLQLSLSLSGKNSVKHSRIRIVIRVK